MGKFIIKEQKNPLKEEYVVLTVRIKKDIRDRFDEIAAKSDYTRNKLVGMALEYALDNLEFSSDDATSAE